MPSIAYQAWVGVRAQNLDVQRRAHRALHGTGPGVRAATAQIHQAYVLRISARFQGFYRDLHTECLDLLLMRISDSSVRAMVRSGLLLDREFDRGNPNPGNIGSDFARLGLPFWAGVVTHRSQNMASVRRQRCS